MSRYQPNSFPSRRPQPWRIRQVIFQIYLLRPLRGSWLQNYFVYNNQVKNISITATFTSSPVHDAVGFEGQFTDHVSGLSVRVILCVMCFATWPCGCRFQMDFVVIIGLRRWWCWWCWSFRHRLYCWASCVRCSHMCVVRPLLRRHLWQTKQILKSCSTQGTHRTRCFVQRGLWRLQRSVKYLRVLLCLK